QRRYQQLMDYPQLYHHQYDGRVLQNHTLIAPTLPEHNIMLQNQYGPTIPENVHRGYPVNMENQYYQMNEQQNHHYGRTLSQSQPLYRPRIPENMHRGYPVNMENRYHPMNEQQNHPYGRPLSQSHPQPQIHQSHI